MRWLRGALIEFIRKPNEIDDGHEYLRIESRIQASLLADEDLPEWVFRFVSAAHWLQAGVRLYHARRREPAYRILKRAHSRRAEFATASRTELTRYFCLSATRNGRYDESESCILLLDGAYQIKGMAAFLRADLFEYQRMFVQAISEYQRAIDLNKKNERRLEQTYRPLIRCILASPRPNFRLAECYAFKSLKLRETVFSLMALARVYLHWKYLGHQVGREIPDDIDKRYRDALEALERHPGIGSAHFELKADEAHFSNDFAGAIGYMDRAIGADPRFELRTERWRLMASSGMPEFAEQALSELNAARHNQEYKGNWLPFLPALAEVYCRALKATGRPFGAINTFAPQLRSEEISAIVGRVRAQW